MKNRKDGKIMGYYIEIYDFEGKKIVDASIVELDIVMKLLEVYKAFPKIIINGIYVREGGSE